MLCFSVDDALMNPFSTNPGLNILSGIAFLKYLALRLACFIFVNELEALHL